MKINFKSYVLIIIFFFALLIPRLKAEPDLSELAESEKTISMDLKDASLKDVLKIFSIQSGLNFIASEAVKDRLVTLYLDKVPIRETMTRLFKANKLIYEYDKTANMFVVMYADDTQEPDTVTKIFSLKYRSVASANLEKQKASMFNQATGTGTASTTSGTDLIDSVKQLLSKNGKVCEDPGTNSLIVTDLASRIPAIEELIFGLDQPQPQVMLEVEVLDVSKNLMDKLGFDLGNINETPNPLSLILKDSGRSDFFIGDLSKRAASLATSGIAGTTVIGNYYSALLSFLAQQQDTKYLARPRILTLNNETAEIAITKDEVMSLKMARTVDSAGNTNVDITYDRATQLTLTPEGIGIFLRVTPHINMDTGEITMVVYPKTSSATDSVTISTGGTTSFYRDPEVRSTKSIIKIKDGETVVLGGMIHQEKQETRQKIPILGDIPFVGALFRNRNLTRNKERELLVFITPRIMKDSVVEIVKRGDYKNSSLNQTVLSQSTRKQGISDLLNAFEREKNIDGQRKVSQVGGTVN